MSTLTCSICNEETDNSDAMCDDCYWLETRLGRRSATDN
jgi:NMD protein affecting ribosome stability and mRNA decay